MTKEEIQALESIINKCDYPQLVWELIAKLIKENDRNYFLKTVITNTC